MEGRTDEYYMKVLREIVGRGVDLFWRREGFGVKTSVEEEVARELLMSCPRIRALL